MPVNPLNGQEVADVTYQEANPQLEVASQLLGKLDSLQDSVESLSLVAQASGRMAEDARHFVAGLATAFSVKVPSQEIKSVSSVFNKQDSRQDAGGIGEQASILSAFIGRLSEVSIEAHLPPQDHLPVAREQAAKEKESSKETKTVERETTKIADFAPVIQNAVSIAAGVAIGKSLSQVAKATANETVDLMPLGPQPRDRYGKYAPYQRSQRRASSPTSPELAEDNSFLAPRMGILEQPIAQGQMSSRDVKEALRDISKSSGLNLRGLVSRVVMRPDIAIKGQRAFGYYRGSTGEVGINLGNVTDEEKLKETLGHEVIGHGGYRAIGPEHPAAQEFAAAAIQTPQVASRLRKYDPSKYSREQLVEEAFAQGVGLVTSGKAPAHLARIFHGQVVPAISEAGSQFGSEVMPYLSGPAGFYSKLKRSIQAMPPSMKGQALVPYLTKRGVTKEEIEWSGVKDLAERERFTREEALSTLEASRLDIDEVFKGGEKAPELEWKEAGRRGTPGQDDFRTIYKTSGSDVELHKLAPDEYGQELFEVWTTPPPESEQEAERIRERDASDRGGEERQVIHWLESFDEAKHVAQNAIYKKLGLSNEEARYSNYRSEGTKKYKELLFTIPPKEEASFRLMQLESIPEEDLTRAERRELEQIKSSEYGSARKYHSPHWQETNVLAHIRFGEMLTPDYTEEEIEDIRDKKVGGKSIALLEMAEKEGRVTPEEAAKVRHYMERKYGGKKARKEADQQIPGVMARSLHVEEIQSDWHQEGRERGYDLTEDEFNQKRAKLNALLAEEQEVRKAKSRFLSEEMEPKYGDSNFPGGPKTDLVESMAFLATPEELDTFSRFDESLEKIERQKVQIARELTPTRKLPRAPFREDWSELAMRRMLLEAARGGYDHLTWNTGAQIKSLVGGEESGQEKFYDERLVNWADKFGKKYGVEVVAGEGDRPHMLKITPQMREDILKKGFPISGKPSPVDDDVMPSLEGGASDEASEAAARILAQMGMGDYSLRMETELARRRGRTRKETRPEEAEPPLADILSTPLHPESEKAIRARGIAERDLAWTWQKLVREDDVTNLDVIEEPKVDDLEVVEEKKKRDINNFYDKAVRSMSPKYRAKFNQRQLEVDEANEARKMLAQGIDPLGVTLAMGDLYPHRPIVPAHRVAELAKKMGRDTQFEEEWRREVLKPGGTFSGYVEGDFGIEIDEEGNVIDDAMPSLESGKPKQRRAKAGGEFFLPPKRGEPGFDEYQAWLKRAKAEQRPAAKKAGGGHTFRGGSPLPAWVDIQAGLREPEPEIPPVVSGGAVGSAATTMPGAERRTDKSESLGQNVLGEPAFPPEAKPIMESGLSGENLIDAIDRARVKGRERGLSEFAKEVAKEGESEPFQFGSTLDDVRREFNEKAMEAKARSEVPPGFFENPPSIGGAKVTPGLFATFKKDLRDVLIAEYKSNLPPQPPGEGKPDESKKGWNWWEWGAAKSGFPGAPAFVGSGEAGARRELVDRAAMLQSQREEAAISMRLVGSPEHLNTVKQEVSLRREMVSLARAEQRTRNLVEHGPILGRLRNWSDDLAPIGHTAGGMFGWGMAALGGMASTSPALGGTLGGSMQLLGLAGAGVFAPTILEVSKAIQDVAKWIENLDPAMKENIATWAKWGLGATGAAFAIGKLLPILGHLGTGLGLIAKHPVVAAITAITLASGKLGDVLGGVSNVLSKIGEGFEKLTGAKAAPWLKETFFGKPAEEGGTGFGMRQVVAIGAVAAGLHYARRGAAGLGLLGATPSAIAAASASGVQMTPAAAAFVSGQPVESRWRRAGRAFGTSAAIAAPFMGMALDQMNFAGGGNRQGLMGGGFWTDVGTGAAIGAMKGPVGAVVGAGIGALTHFATSRPAEVQVQAPSTLGELRRRISAAMQIDSEEERRRVLLATGVPAEAIDRPPPGPFSMAGRIQHLVAASINNGSPEAARAIAAYRRENPMLVPLETVPGPAAPARPAVPPRMIPEGIGTEAERRWMNRNTPEMEEERRSFWLRRMNQLQPPRPGSSPAEIQAFQNQVNAFREAAGRAAVPAGQPGPHVPAPARPERTFSDAEVAQIMARDLQGAASLNGGGQSGVLGRLFAFGREQASSLRREAAVSLGFQSQQIAVESLHDIVQQEATRDPISREVFQQQLERLDQIVRWLTRAGISFENWGVMGSN